MDNVQGPQKHAKEAFSEKEKEREKEEKKRREKGKEKQKRRGAKEKETHYYGNCERYISVDVKYICGNICHIPNEAPSDYPR